MEKRENKLSKFRFFAILILVLAGIGMCIELGYIFYKTNFLTSYAPSFCAVSQLVDCDGVAQTTYALSAGIPNALWGLILYVVILMLLFVDKIQAKFKNTIFDVFKNPRSYIATLGVVSFLISMVLAFISIKVINKICILCFCTYFVNLFIAIFAKNKGPFHEDIIITVKDFIEGAKKYFALFLIVLIAFISTLVYCEKTLIFSPKLKQERLHKEFYESKVNKYAVKGNILGKENAKVTINVYSDYNCPFCKVVNIMIHKIAREKNILIHEINFPLDTNCNKKIGRTLGGHEASCLASKYALAAEKQGKFWGVANVLFENQPRNEEEIITQIKDAHLNIDIEQLQKDAKNPDIEKIIQEDIERTVSKNIKGTPSLEIDGIIYEGIMPYDELVKKIDLAIKRANN